MTKAVVLLSGGLDSATVLAMALQQGFECYALSFDYGQRHNIELHAARRLALNTKVAEHKIIQLDLGSIGGSALTDARIAIPTTISAGIPVTYVPARNTLFLSYALAWAEVLQAAHIFIGVNAIDYSGYPDCRPEYIAAFEKMANLATRFSTEGGNRGSNKITIHTPLIQLTKAAIIQRGIALGVDYSLTISCYQADDAGRACGKCDACRFRAAGFSAAGIADPTRYA